MKIFFLNICLISCFICQAQSPSPKLMISKGHGDGVLVTAMSANGKLLASGSSDKTVIVWDVPSGKELITINDFPSWVKTVALTPDGTKLFSGTEKEMRINDLENNGKEMLRAPFYSDVVSIAISRDGSQAAAIGQAAKGPGGDAMYELKIFNTTSAKLIKTVTGKGTPIQIMYSSNEELLILTGKTIEHLDINSGNISSTENYSLNDLDLMSPDGKYVIITGFDTQADADEDFDGGLFNLNKGAAYIKVFDRKTQQIIHTFKGSNNSIKNFAFSPDSHYLMVSAGGAIYCYDFLKMKYANKFAEKIWSPEGISFTADGKTFVGGSEDKKIRLWNFETKNLKQILGGEANVIKDIAMNADGKTMAFIGTTDYYSGSLNIMDLQRGTLTGNHFTDDMFPKIEYSADGKLLLAARFEKGLRSWNSDLPQEEGKIITPDKTTAFAISPDNHYLIKCDKNAALTALAIYSLPDGKFLKSLIAPSSIWDLKFAPDSKNFYIATTGGQNVYRANVTTGLIDKTYAPKVVDKTLWASKIELNKDGSQMLVAEPYGATRWYNIATGVETKGNNLQGSRINDAILLPGTNQIITCGGEAAFPDPTIKFSDFTTHQVVKTLNIPGSSGTALGVTLTGKYLFTATFDRRVLIWDLSTNKIIATLVFFEAGDWVVADETGRFDGTQGGMKKMYYVKNLQIITLESAFEKFYTPGLLSSLLKGEIIPAPPIDINTLKAPPIVKISYTEAGRNLVVEDDSPEYKTTNGQAKIEVNASCPADAVTEIRLYQNGKLVGGTRNLVVEDDATASAKMNKVFTVNLLPGVNTFKAIALNKQRTESIPILLTVNYSPSQNDVPVTSNITLHMLVVGINIYKNPKYNLNYAQADAEAFKNTITKGSESLFSKTDVVYLSNEQATQTGISQALEKIKNETKPQDLFIFYYAGHGVINDKKEFFLVPFDVTQLYGNDDALAQKGFSAAALQQWSKDIKAQKQLFILDACQSAGALQTVAGSRGAAEEKAIAQLARSTGTQWLTASGSEQFASEFEALGHGSFTYCILQALSGAANKGGSQLTVKQLDAYLQTAVPEITEKYKGTPQYPASFSYGNDFPIYIFK
ncbi:MAG: caspase family protein [Ferruginibacter sp.]